MFYTYVLLSLKDNKFYIGFTGDLKRRLAEHNSGKNISTKPRRPLKLIYYEAHLSKADAERREQYFQDNKRQIFFETNCERVFEKPVTELIYAFAGYSKKNPNTI